eukprot:TRINITY_DN7902_c0_g1_i1.p1 TRINITY_DN7902_c0_g1~~TRINITY_DN7902_c0_g1_i1.p1  ORF type:complete len:1118 (-),score=250.69 TRINITY_DN7902_c0_g1_i1:61-3384(-)
MAGYLARRLKKPAAKEREDQRAASRLPDVWEQNFAENFIVTKFWGSARQDKGITQVLSCDDGTVVAVDTRNNCIRHLSATGSEIRCIGENVLLRPKGVCEVHGGLLVCDTGHNRIRFVTWEGSVQSFAGSGRKGWRDGVMEEAQFNQPTGICMVGDGLFAVADTKNHCIRLISLRERMVTSIAGSGEGFEDGPAKLAKFNSPSSIVVGLDCTLIVCDTKNHCIRKISADGNTVRTVAGGKGPGCVDGAARSAKFDKPYGMCVMPDGSILISDRVNNCIRRLTKDDRTVTTVAGGSQKEWGLVDGRPKAARFNLPSGISIGRQSNAPLFIADTANGVVRKISKPDPAEQQQPVRSNVLGLPLQQPPQQMTTTVPSAAAAMSTTMTTMASSTLSQYPPQPMQLQSSMQAPVPPREPMLRAAPALRSRSRAGSQPAVTQQPAQMPRKLTLAEQQRTELQHQRIALEKQRDAHLARLEEEKRLLAAAQQADARLEQQRIEVETHHLMELQRQMNWEAQQKQFGSPEVQLPVRSPSKSRSPTRSPARSRSQHSDQKHPVQLHFDSDSSPSSPAATGDQPLAHSTPVGSRHSQHSHHSHHSQQHQPGTPMATAADDAQPQPVVRIDTPDHVRFAPVHTFHSPPSQQRTRSITPHAAPELTAQLTDVVPTMNFSYLNTMMPPVTPGVAPSPAQMMEPISRSMLGPNTSVDSRSSYGSFPRAEQLPPTPLPATALQQEVIRASSQTSAPLSAPHSAAGVTTVVPLFDRSGSIRLQGENNALKIQLSALQEQLTVGEVNRVELETLRSEALAYKAQIEELQVQLRHAASTRVARNQEPYLFAYESFVNGLVEQSIQSANNDDVSSALQQLHMKLQHALSVVLVGLFEVPEEPKTVDEVLHERLPRLFADLLRLQVDCVTFVDISHYYDVLHRCCPANRVFVEVALADDLDVTLFCCGEQFFVAAGQQYSLTVTIGLSEQDGDNGAVTSIAAEGQPGMDLRYIPDKRAYRATFTLRSPPGSEVEKPSSAEDMTSFEKLVAISHCARLTVPLSIQREGWPAHRSFALPLQVPLCVLPSSEVLDSHFATIKQYAQSAARGLPTWMHKVAATTYRTTLAL